MKDHSSAAGAAAMFRPNSYAYCRFGGTADAAATLILAFMRSSQFGARIATLLERHGERLTGIVGFLVLLSLVFFG